jgi:GMP synthase (glutamine-hydrolysing)
MKSKPVWIIQTGTAADGVRQRFGDFPHWFRIGAGLDREEVQVLSPHQAVDADGAQARALILTGSAAMVSERAAWSEALAAWIRAQHGRVPMLGVCFGHQLIAHAFGGAVDYNPRGREIGTVDVQRLESAQDDVLFAKAPAQFPAQATHLQSVLRPPREAVILARSALDDCQAFRIGRHTWGLQFHPEFSADVMRAYIHAREEAVSAEGLDPRVLACRVSAAPQARKILRRFAAWSRGTL